MLNKEEIINYVLNYSIKNGSLYDNKGKIVINPEIIRKYNMAIQIYQEAKKIQLDSDRSKDVVDFFEEAINNLDLNIDRSDSSNSGDSSTTENTTQENTTTTESEDSSKENQPNQTDSTEPVDEEQDRINSSSSIPDVEIKDDKVKKVVSARLAKWDSRKTKTSFLRTLTKKFNGFSQEFEQIYHNIGILKVHYSLWSMPKIIESIKIIQNDIENCQALSVHEKKKLNIELAEISGHVRADQAIRQHLGTEVSENKTLRGENIERVVPVPTTSPEPPKTEPEPPVKDPEPTPEPEPEPPAKAPEGLKPPKPLDPPTTSPGGFEPPKPLDPPAPAPGTPEPPIPPVPPTPGTSTDELEEYRKYMQRAPRITKDTYDSLSTDEKIRYLQAEASRAYVCSDFKTILMVMDYYREIDSEDLNLDDGPFRR